MKIKRTVKKECMGIPFKYAGETTTIDRDKMEKIIDQTTLSLLRATPHKPYGHDEAMKDLVANGKIETFYATYELIEA